MGVQSSSDLSGIYDERFLDDTSRLKRVEVTLPIVKHRGYVENISPVLLGLEKEFKLAVRFGRVDIVPPELLLESRPGTWNKATHGLAELELKKKRRPRSVERYVKA